MRLDKIDNVLRRSTVCKCGLSDTGEYSHVAPECALVTACGIGAGRRLTEDEQVNEYQRVSSAFSSWDS